MHRPITHPGDLLTYQERHRSTLDEFLYELRTEFADPHAITRFDQLDFVFIDGDGSSSPWAPSARKLALLVKMCMMTGKCLFATGLGASLIAYVCATGGELLRVLNNSGKGEVLTAINNLPPPSDAEKQNEAVYLDIKSGDFFAYTPRDNSWTPKGNTGIVLHSSDDSRSFYGARPNSARAGGVNKSGHGKVSLYLEKRGEERCCARLEALRDHSILRAALSSCGNNAAVQNNREVILRCTSRWDIDEEISSTGANKFRVLMDSARGPMLIEFGNCLGSHFELDARAHPSTLELLRQFLRLKYEELKVHAHLDRSYVAAISGDNARIRERLVLAQNKRVARPLSAGSAQPNMTNRSAKPCDATPISTTQLTEVHSGSTGVSAPGMSPGRTSPKRCRPLSAGPQRSVSKVNVPTRTVQTSRSVYPNSSMGITSASGSTSVPVMAVSRANENNHTPDTDSALVDITRSRNGKHREGWNEPEARPETDEIPTEIYTARSNASTSYAEEKPKPKPRIVRVPQKNELEKPYCAFSKRRDDDQQQAPANDYYSVVNDAPYMSIYERELVEQQVSEYWIAFTRFNCKMLTRKWHAAEQTPLGSRTLPRCGWQSINSSCT